jgi:hypothetical protein
VSTGRRSTIDVDELAVTRDAAAPDTLDELPPIRAQGSRRLPEGVVATPEGEVADGPTEIDGWAELKAIHAIADAARTEAKAAAELAKKNVAAMSRRWGWVIAVVGLLTAAISPVSYYTAKKLLASAEAHGVETERDHARIDDHAMLIRHDSLLSEIRGELRVLNPVGVLRLQGPPRNPDPDPGAP